MSDALRLAAGLLLVGCVFRLLEGPVSGPVTDRDLGDETLEGLCPRCITLNRMRMRQGRVPRGVGRLRFARDGSAWCGVCRAWLWPVAEGREWMFLREATAG